VESIRRILRTGGASPQEETAPESGRAEALLHEFESSEKGWFWETGRDGTLAYISDSVAGVLGREAVDRNR
jgi:hypothetical protein